MRTPPSRAQKEAESASRALDNLLGEDRFPVDVEAVATSLSKAKSRTQQITRVMGADLPGFEGALLRSGEGSRDWTLLYNNRERNEGRVRFTLAHELGHFVLHLDAHPEGFQCTASDLSIRGGEYRQMELEANIFATHLLMPGKHVRRHLGSRKRPAWQDLATVANMFGVSLLAATRRWLEVTATTSVLVVSRDGFIDWCKASDKAFRRGRYFKQDTVVAVPQGSPAFGESQDDCFDLGLVNQPAGAWFDEPVVEICHRSRVHGYCLSLLFLD